MTPKAKSALLLVATLLIGMVLGALLNARLAERRIERIVFLRSQHGFMRYMEEVIDPHDEEQREAVRVILGKASESLSDQMVRSRQETRAIIESTIEELRSVLTPEQMQQLEERMKRRPQFRRDGMNRRRPPPR